MVAQAAQSIRIISRLDIKGPNLIKGIHLEGLRVIGDPQVHAQRYYDQGADELIFMDTVASLYGRNNLSDIIARAAERIFVPLTVGGGLRSTEDVRAMLRSGADKVAINTAATARPELIGEVARQFGSQCMVLGVEAKAAGAGRWEVFTDNGREETGRDVLEWCREAAALGAGEILLTSVDREGTRKGYDVDLIAAVAAVVSVPIIASGGLGEPADAVTAVTAGADAVALADGLHYDRTSVAEVRSALAAEGIQVRSIEQAR